jgi:hypothetical protein
MGWDAAIAIEQHTLVSFRELFQKHLDVMHDSWLIYCDSLRTERWFPYFPAGLVGLQTSGR